MRDITGALQVYKTATDYMLAAGLEQEIVWQRRTCLDSLSETVFLREAAWVVLCSGFRESIVRRAFNYISLCYCDWESATAISQAGSTCVLAAKAAFANKAKLDALVKIARRVEHIGFDKLKREVLCDPISTLRQFPFIGPVTVRHLAKNLGFDTAKPDRHLVRVAENLGFENPDELCAVISEMSGDPVKVVDLVVWRFLAETVGAANRFSTTQFRRSSGMNTRSSEH